MITALLPALLAANIVGTVTLSNGRPAGNAVVWLDGDAKSKPMAKAVVDQRNRTFVPHISVVTVGTQVQFPNNDTVFHNVFAAFDAKKFDLGLYPRGKTKVQKFDKPGLVALMCSIHSEMSAFVMVVDTPFFAVTDGKGAFRIADMVPGAYRLRAWHETGETSEAAVQLRSDRTFTVKLARP